jgi:hypothetical protein
MDGGVFSGDLDGNGTTDYVIVGGSVGNGRLAPPGWMTVLLIDPQGLPVPFEAPLYDGAGEKHVVDVLHNGHAQLALGAYDENGWDDRSSVFCSGHWVTDLYEAAGLNWQAFRGTASGTAFPLVHRWTYWPECSGPPPVPWKEVFHTGKYSTASLDAPGVRVGTAGGYSVDAAPTSGCDSLEIGSVVYERSNRRDIALAAKWDYQTDLLDRVGADNANIVLRGLYRQPENGNCRANLVWATK